MKLTVAVKLQPTLEQARSLLSTIERANDVANYVSEWAWQNRTFAQYTLHKALYYRVRDEFALSAQIVVRLIAKVADAYKLDKKTRRTFRKHGSIPYDSRILNWYQARSEVTITTIVGRIRLAYLSDERARRLLLSQQGESDLVLRDGQFYLHATVNVNAPEPQPEPENENGKGNSRGRGSGSGSGKGNGEGSGDGWLGVDLGIVNIAVDSEGNVYCGSAVKRIRHRNRRLRAKLQSKGTKGAKRLLKARKRKERRFATYTNHVISKRIVATAKALSLGIGLEELGGIRDRAPVWRGQRATLHSWSFYQLRGFIEYKARLAGVRVVAVDPRNTSRTCPVCGCIDKANRRTQSQFLCVSCGYACAADTNAALNIGRRAALVSQPYLPKLRSQSQVLGKSLAL